MPDHEHRVRFRIGVRYDSQIASTLSLAYYYPRVVLAEAIRERASKHLLCLVLGDAVPEDVGPPCFWVDVERCRYAADLGGALLVLRRSPRGRAALVRQLDRHVSQPSQG